MKWYLTGDCHGDFSHFDNLQVADNEFPSEIGVIILGDAGINVHGHADDDERRLNAAYRGFQLYCVRGNHELRPEQAIENVQWRYDKNVNGFVWQDKEYLNLHYLEDGERYCINGNRILVLGGAYSVDKQDRLMTNRFWNSQEQLSQEEMDKIYDKKSCEFYDIILSHTCPLEWQPTDLFYKFMDQSTVDKTTERFLSKFAEKDIYKVWCWGHFHKTREYPLTKNDQKRMMIFHDFVPIEYLIE